MTGSKPNKLTRTADDKSHRDQCLDCGRPSAEPLCDQCSRGTSDGIRPTWLGWLEGEEFSLDDENYGVDEFEELFEEWRALTKKPAGVAGTWSYYIVGDGRERVACRIDGRLDAGYIVVLSPEIRQTVEEARRDITAWCMQEGITMNTSAGVLRSSETLVKRPTSGGAGFKEETGDE